MNALVSLIVAFLGLVTSAHVKVAAVLFGSTVSTSLLGVIAAVAILGLAALVLWIARNLIQDGLRLRPHPRTAT